MNYVYIRATREVAHSGNVLLLKKIRETLFLKSYVLPSAVVHVSYRFYYPRKIDHKTDTGGSSTLPKYLNLTYKFYHIRRKRKYAY